MADLVVGKISTQRFQVYVEWKMEEYFDLCQKADCYHRSPPFSYMGFSWCLVVYPNGQRCHHSVDFVGLYLERIDNSSESIRVDFRIGFKGVNGLYKNIPKSHNFAKNEVCGWPCLSDRQELLRKKHMFKSGVTAFCILELNNASNGAPARQIAENITTLSNDFRALLANEYKSDVVIKLQDQRLRAHKLILSARSRVFAAMFERAAAEDNAEEVDLADYEPEAVRSFLAYLYAGRTDNLTLDTVFSLLSLAEEFELRVLKAACFSFIERNLCVEIVCDALAMADKHNKENLKNEAIEFLSTNIKEVMQTSEWIKFIVENPALATKVLLTIIPE